MELERRTSFERNVGVDLLEVCPDLIVLNLRVVDVDEGLLGHEVLDEGDGGGLASVASICLKGKAEDSDALEINQSP